MKILILANNCKWKTWDKKIQELKDWWMPEINLDVTLEHTDFKNTVFRERVETLEVERKTFQENIKWVLGFIGFGVIITVLKVVFGVL